MYFIWKETKPKKKFYNFKKDLEALEKIDIGNGPTLIGP